MAIAVKLDDLLHDRGMTLTELVRKRRHDLLPAGARRLCFEAHHKLQPRAILSAVLLATDNSGNT
jgi:hypothetical protein